MLSTHKSLQQHLSPPLVSSRTEWNKIICAHCTCIAGLGEACSHISALSFLKPTHRLGKNTSCTSTSCTWLTRVSRRLSIYQFVYWFYNSSETKKSYRGQSVMFLCIASSSFGDEGAEKPTKEKLQILYKSYLTARKCLHSCQLCQANMMPTFRGQKEKLKCGNRSTETEIQKWEEKPPISV